MGQSPNSNTTTLGVRVEAAAQFDPERSDPDRPHHFYAYRIRITNEGEDTVQLLRRRWEIRDANNNTETVSGNGVVGYQPTFESGMSFEYTSYCPLKTEWGTMEGCFTFERKGGEHFDVAVGRFFLVPSADNAEVF
ncbi:MAG: Co2+/Mg2+ efflux protein ApaG [Psychrobacter sp.]|nr:Co2+/Mg2+ efflux protein ApaG [Psychrobacter sp.]